MTDRISKRQRVVVNENTWDCSLCTYKNPCVAFRCEMCDSSKGTATRKPKLVVSDHVEHLPRSKRKTHDDNSSDVSLTDDSDVENDDDDDDDEEFQENERKSTNRRIIHNEHLNESISSPASSSTTTRSNRSISPSSSSKITDHSKLSTTKKRTPIISIPRSTKSTSALITTNKKTKNENDQKNSNKHQPTNSKDNKQRQLNENNQKNKTANDERNKKNLVQQKTKKSKFSSLSSMSSSSSTSSTSSSIHNTTVITVDGVSVRITELLPNETSSSIILNVNDTSRASSSSPITQTSS